MAPAWVRASGSRRAIAFQEARVDGTAFVLPRAWSLELQCFLLWLPPFQTAPQALAAKASRSTGEAIARTQAALAELEVERQKIEARMGQAGKEAENDAVEAKREAHAELDALEARIEELDRKLSED